MDARTNKMNETAAAPKRKLKLCVFNSFEAAAEAEAMEDARKPPLDGLRDTVELILRAWGVTREGLMANRNKMHITIIKQG